jgi:hypothetical protein
MKFVKVMMMALMVGLLSTFAFAQKTTKASPKVAPAAAAKVAAPADTSKPAPVKKVKKTKKHHHKKGDAAVVK